MRLFAVRRADIELFARDLETAGRARATVGRRLSTIAGLYKYAVEEDLLDRSPAAHVRRPRLDNESHATGLDRNEVGAHLACPISGPFPKSHSRLHPRLGNPRAVHPPLPTCQAALISATAAGSCAPTRHAPSR